MAESKTILTAIATSSAKLPDLTIKNGQLIFVQDTHKIALDFNDTRIFYNRIVELGTEDDRVNTEAEDGLYYFVLSSCCFWTYQNGSWVQLTAPPEDIVIIDTENPAIGVEDKLYVDKTAQSVSVWSDATSNYICVGNAVEEIATDEISALFE